MENVSYSRKKDKINIFTPNFKVLLLLLLFIMMFFASFSLGRYDIEYSELVKILFSKIIPIDKTWTDSMENVVLNVRLPRIILACLVGGCLSVAGACYQGVFQNPMASPDLLGATSGAAFGAALAILYGASSQLISMSAFVFSLITVFVVFIMGQKIPGKKVVNLILAGIMISSLFSAGTSFIKLVADPTNQLPSITYWLMGSLSGARNKEVIFVAFPMIAGLVPLFAIRWRINILTLNDEESHAMGVNSNVIRLIVILSATLITAASVSISGMIGWVGLVIPHMCRKIMGNNYKYLLPTSMIFGSTFMLFVDNISRNLLATEIPIGILTAFIGAPFFGYLIFMKEGNI